MFLRFTLSQFQQQDPGDLIIDAANIVAVLEGRGKDNQLTAMIYTLTGEQFHVRDDQRDAQERVLIAKGEMIE